MMQLSTLAFTALLAFAGLVTSEPITNTTGTGVLNFDALLEGSLGNMPALFLVGQGALLEVHAAAPSKEVALAQDPATAATASAPPATQPGDGGRTDKENGAALGIFISSMLIPAAVNIADGTLAGGICKSLVAGAGGMLGAVVGQEAGKALYPNGTTDTTASGLEQGIIPGTFIGGIAGGSVGTALSKTLCSKLVPDLEKVLKGLNPDAVTKVSRILNRGLADVLTAHLKDLGVEPAKAMNFAHQMGETLRLADTLGMPDAFDFLNRELVSNTADLTKAAGKGLLTTPAIDNLVKLSSQTFSMGLPWGGAPFSPAQEPMSALQAFTGQYKQILDSAKSVPGARKAAESLSGVTGRLHSAALDAAGLLKKGSLDEARTILDGAADDARAGPEIVRMEHDSGGRDVKNAFKTETKTLTIQLTHTLTSVQMRHITSIHTVTATTNTSSNGTCSMPATTAEQNTSSATKRSSTLTKIVFKSTTTGGVVSTKTKGSTVVTPSQPKKPKAQCDLCKGESQRRCSQSIAFLLPEQNWKSKLEPKCAVCAGLSSHRCATRLRDMPPDEYREMTTNK